MDADVATFLARCYALAAEDHYAGPHVLVAADPEGEALPAAQGPVPGGVVVAMAEAQRWQDELNDGLAPDEPPFRVHVVPLFAQGG